MKLFFIVMFSMYFSMALAQLPDSLDNHEIQVSFHPNIEFAGLIFFMGSLAEEAATAGTTMPNGTPQQDWFAYDLSLYKQYYAYRKDTNLLTAKEYLERLQPQDIIPLLLQSGKFPNARLQPGISYESIKGFAPGADSMEVYRQVNKFLTSLNVLYNTMSFDTYFRQAKRLYETAFNEIMKVMPGKGFIATMESFYRQKFNKYALLPSLTIPAGMAFGVHTGTAANQNIYNVFGPFALQQFQDSGNINMGFSDPRHIRELSVHEFGHSFVNPVFSLVPDSLVASVSHLYLPIKTAMEDQGYPSWDNCLTEHLVRAGEILIARRMGLETDAGHLLKHYTEDRKFIYLPIIIPVLESYANDKAQQFSYYDAILKSMEEMKKAE